MSLGSGCGGALYNMTRSTSPADPGIDPSEIGALGVYILRQVRSLTRCHHGTESYLILAMLECSYGCLLSWLLSLLLFPFSLITAFSSLNV